LKKNSGPPFFNTANFCDFFSRCPLGLGGPNHCLCQGWPHLHHFVFFPPPPPRLVGFGFSYFCTCFFWGVSPFFFRPVWKNFAFFLGLLLGQGVGGGGGGGVGGKRFFLPTVLRKFVSFLLGGGVCFLPLVSRGRLVAPAQKKHGEMDVLLGGLPDFFCLWGGGGPLFFLGPPTTGFFGGPFPGKTQNRGPEKPSVFFSFFYSLSSFSSLCGRIGDGPRTFLALPFFILERVEPKKPCFLAQRFPDPHPSPAFGARQVRSRVGYPVSLGPHPPFLLQKGGKTRGPGFVPGFGPQDTLGYPPPPPQKGSFLPPVERAPKTSSFFFWSTQTPLGAFGRGIVFFVEGVGLWFWVAPGAVFAKMNRLFIPQSWRFRPPD